MQLKSNVRRKKGSHWICNTEVNTDCDDCFNGTLGTEVLLKWFQKRTNIECVGQWNRIESPKINSYIYDSYIYDKLIFNNGAKTIQWRKDYLFKKVLGQLDIHIQKNEDEFHPCTICKN